MSIYYSIKISRLNLFPKSQKPNFSNQKENEKNICQFFQNMVNLKK